MQALPIQRKSGDEGSDMLLWGTGSELVWVGDAGARSCPACQQVCPFRLVLRYGYIHLYFHFGMVTHREFLVVCERCENSFAIGRDEIPDAKLLERDLVPFLHRWGCVVFPLACFAAWLLVCGLVLSFLWFTDGFTSREQRPPEIPGAGVDKNQAPP